MFIVSLLLFLFLLPLLLSSWWWSLCGSFKKSRVSKYGPGHNRMRSIRGAYNDTPRCHSALRCFCLTDTFLARPRRREHGTTAVGCRASPALPSFPVRPGDRGCLALASVHAPGCQRDCLQASTTYCKEKPKPPKTKNDKRGTPQCTFPLSPSRTSRCPPVPPHAPAPRTVALRQVSPDTIVGESVCQHLG